MPLKNFILLLITFSVFAQRTLASSPEVITFNKNFEGGSLGKIEKLEDSHFRCFIEGQHDEHGRNRQANWYYFRMDGVQDRDITLVLTDFVGEYNNKPGSCAMTADTIPLFSYDNVNWRHFPSMEWDDQKKEATLRFRPENSRIWIAHLEPYTPSRLLKLLDELNRAPHARIEVIGNTAQKRDLHLVTVTNFDKPDDQKKCVWLQARQHAWETGTSFVMEGALRFIASDDANARALRDRIIFKFTPMLDPDGCAEGKVRFNANGYDVNRHWPEADLRRKEVFEKMPEIWYAKKAILAWRDSGRGIDLMLNMHNEESGEYLETQCDDETLQKMMQKFYVELAGSTSFDPSQKLRVNVVPPDTTNSLWKERKIPVLLLEQRIATSAKLGRRPTSEDRLEFGKQLITVMGQNVLK